MIKTMAEDMKQKLNTKKNHPKFLSYKRDRGGYWIGLLWMIWLVSSCAEERVHKTEHPELGKLILTTRWELGPNQTVPGRYTIRIGDTLITKTETEGVLIGMFNPNTYRMSIYNTPGNLTVSGNVATVNAAATPSGETGPFIGFLPSVFASAVRDIKILPDKDLSDTVSVYQQTRELTVRIIITGEQSSVSLVEAVLSGVATQLDFSSGTGTLSGEASISAAFVKNGGYYEIKGFLLGVTGQQPHLKVKLLFGGSVQPLTRDFSLTEQLRDFNNSDNLKTPLTVLAGTIVIPETPETPVNPSVGSTIDPWDNKNHTINH
jgi:hypothetical protein